MRLFVGIPMDARVAEQLAGVRARTERPQDGLRWSAPESWHITLQFLGAASAAQFDYVVAGLGEIRAQRVPVKLEGLGFFDRAGVFFADVRVSPELEALQKSVTAATSACGFVAEDRAVSSAHNAGAQSRARERGACAQGARGCSAYVCGARVSAVGELPSSPSIRPNHPNT